MIPRIKSVKPVEGFKLHVIFDDGKDVIYDVGDDIKSIPNYADLKIIYGLFNVTLPKGTVDKIHSYGFAANAFARELIIAELEKLDKARSEKSDKTRH